MSDNKDFVKEITNIDEDFARWYTDIVIKAQLADYTDTKGCIAIRPYGYAIWENIQRLLDAEFKQCRNRTNLQHQFVGIRRSRTFRRTAGNGLLHRRFRPSDLLHNGVFQQFAGQHRGGCDG